MARTIDEIIATLPKAERDAIAARAHELVGEEMSLQAIRKAMGKTQVAVAKGLKLRQDAVSKIETRAHMLISTLRGCLKAVGGKLELVATFPDRPPVHLGELGRLAPERKREKRAAHRSMTPARKEGPATHFQSWPLTAHFAETAKRREAIKLSQRYCHSCKKVFARFFAPIFRPRAA